MKKLPSPGYCQSLSTIINLTSPPDLRSHHCRHQLPGIDVDDCEGESDVELPDHGEADGPPGVSVNWDKDAGDAGEATDHHRPEENPPPAPLVHDVPANEVGGNLYGRAGEEMLVNTFLFP